MTGITERLKGMSQSSNFKFLIWILDFIGHLDFDIWISETGVILG